MWIAVVAAVLLVAAAAGGIAWAMSRGGGAEAGGVCTVRTVPAQGQGHVDRLPEDFEPASFPRVTGPHHPQTVIYGEYQEPVNQLQLVHNLEHGAVVVQWGADVAEETVNAIRAWYRTDPRGLVIAPLPSVEQAEPLRDEITLGAWVVERENPDDPASRITKQDGKLAICSAFDEDAFNEFLDDYRGKGPEGFTLDQMAPGSG